MMDEYQEDLAEEDRRNVENARLQSLLDMEPKPEIKEEPQSHGGAEEVEPGQRLWEQEGRISLENPEPKLVKKEEEELCTIKEEEQPSDTKDSILTSPCVATDSDQVFAQNELGHGPMQTGENGEMATWDSQLTKAEPQIKTEPEVEGYEEPNTTTDSPIHPEVIPDGTDVVEKESFPDPSASQPGESSGDNSLSDNKSLNTVAKPFKCTECGKRFKHKNYLNRHRLTQHTDDKPFECEICGMCFHFKSEFNRHMKIHAEKTNKCGECGKCFTLKSDLNRHIAMHTRKKFQCKECAKCFKWRSDLTAHMISHTGAKKFTCVECGKCFDTKTHLSCHIVTIHTGGGETFDCKECGKSFNKEHNLNRHMKLHTKDDPSRCKECGKCLRVNRVVGKETIVVRLICEHLLNKKLPD